MAIPQVGSRQTHDFVPLGRALCRHFAAKCFKYLQYLNIKSMRKEEKKSFSFKGSQMKHSSAFSPVSWVSGHPKLMHLSSAGAEEEEVIAKISIAAF